MSDATGERAVVALSVIVLLSGVAPVAAGPAQVDARHGELDTRNQPGTVDALERYGLQYKVSLDNVTVRTWVLRNTTVENASVDEVVVRTLRVNGTTRQNVTLSNVTIDELEIDDGRLQNVTATTLVVRNRSIWNVPGGDLFDPGVSDRVVDRHVLADVTVDGATLDRLVLQNLTVRNATVPSQASGPVVDEQVANVSTDPKPAVEIRNATVQSSVVRNATAGNWSAESIQRGNAPASG